MGFASDGVIPLVGGQTVQTCDFVSLFKLCTGRHFCDTKSTQTRRQNRYQKICS